MRHFHDTGALLTRRARAPTGRADRAQSGVFRSAHTTARKAINTVSASQPWPQPSVRIMEASKASSMENTTSVRAHRLDVIDRTAYERRTNGVRMCAVTFAVAVAVAVVGCTDRPRARREHADTAPAPTAHRQEKIQTWTSTRLPGNYSLYDDEINSFGWTHMRFLEKTC
jgi:hypothetical protein